MIIKSEVITLLINLDLYAKCFTKNNNIIIVQFIIINHDLVFSDTLNPGR